MKIEEFKIRRKQNPKDPAIQEILHKMDEISKKARPIEEELERIEEGEALFPGLYDAYAIDRVGQMAARRKEKRGRSIFSDAEKLAALIAWDRVKANDGMSLSKFLENTFGSSFGTGYLRVPESTFHYWRQKFRKMGLYPPDNSEFNHSFV